VRIWKKCSQQKNWLLWYEAHEMHGMQVFLSQSGSSSLADMARSPDLRDHHDCGVCRVQGPDPVVVRGTLLFLPGK